MQSRRCRTSRGRWRPASSIRANPPRIATEHCAASPAAHLTPTAFVNFLQNHDQIGNRALGDRLESIAKPEAIEAALAITLLAPMVPMLFMGEEWGSKAPFPFFCDFEGDLAEAVRQGRRKEFAGAYAKYGDDVPDPLERIDLPNPRCWIGTRATKRAGSSGWRWCGICSRSAARKSCRGWRALSSARRMRRTTAC